MSQIYLKIIGNNNGNYPYRVGLNTLKHNNEVFNPDKTCGPGGLYYTTPAYIFNYVEFGDKLCIISLPIKAKFVELDDKCKSDSIVIEKIMPLWRLKTISYLISIGANINNKNAGLLSTTAKYGRLEVMRYLVSSIGVDIHANDEQALVLAAMYGNLKVVQYLVYMGADIHINNDQALSLAYRNSKDKVVKYLTSMGCKMDQKTLKRNLRTEK